MRSCPTAADSEYSATTSGWTGTGCREESYGDGQDVMSASSPDFAPFLSAPQSLRTGIMPPSAATVIDTVGTQKVTLLPLAGRTGVRTAEVVNPATGVTYYVEYRTPAGRDLSNVLGVKTGVRVLRYNPATGDTVLLDPSPTGRSLDPDPTLPVGQTFASYDGRVNISTVSANRTNAVVSVTNAPSPLSASGSPTAPSVVITGKPTVSTTSASATLRFSGTHGTDPAGSLRYVCSRDGAAASPCTSPTTYAGLTSAVHTFAVRVIDPSGNNSSTAYTWRVDRVAPTLTMTAPATLYTLTTSLVPAWNAKDVGGGLANVDVRWARAPYNGAFTSAVYPRTWQKTTATRASLPSAAPGYTYCFSARARDKAGNVSAWSAPRCGAVALDDRSLTASTGWARAIGSGFYRNTAAATSRSAVTLTRTRVQARRIYLVATRCPRCGTVGVYWNGTLIKRVSLYASTTTRRSVLGIRPFTSVRSGTLTIRTLVSNKAVQIDGVALVRR